MDGVDSAHAEEIVYVFFVQEGQQRSNGDSAYQAPMVIHNGDVRVMLLECSVLLPIAIGHSPSTLIPTVCGVPLQGSDETVAGHPGSDDYDYDEQELIADSRWHDRDWPETMGLLSHQLYAISHRLFAFLRGLMASALPLRYKGVVQGAES
jgi:hypothetical protein